MTHIFDTIGYFDINLETEDNDLFRRVICTTPNMQVVLMTLKPGVDIGEETHRHVCQFFRVEMGTGLAVVNDIQYILRPGVALVVPQKTKHNIINNGTEPLRLYTIYSPPNHPHNRVDFDKPMGDD